MGKTLISVLLARELEAYYWKPVQSGAPPYISRTDSQFVARFIGKERVLKESYILSQPLSPHQAAALDSCEIDLNSLKIPLEKLPSPAPPLIVEGAGGVMVPLNERQTMLDLMKQCSLPVVVVTRSGLGTLNHSLLTLRELKRQQIQVHGLVLVGPPHPYNPRDLVKFSGIPVLGEVPLKTKSSGKSQEEEMMQDDPIEEKWFKERADILLHKF